MRFRFSTLMLTLAAVLSLAAAAQAGPYYYVTDLGFISTATYANAYGMNNNGDVVGRARISSTDTRFYAYLYTQGKMYNLGYLEDASLSSDMSRAVAINDNGQITGYSRYTPPDPPGGTSTTHAFLYDGWEIDGSGNFVPGTMNDLDVLTIWEDEQYKTGTNSKGNGINAAGDVVGFSTVGTGRGFISASPDYNMVESGYLDMAKKGSASNAINDSGQITGWSYVTAVLPSGATTFYQHGFITDAEGTLHDLGTLGGNSNTQGRAINSSGQVAGLSELADGTDRAFFYDYTTDEMVEIAPLLDGQTNDALGINEDGDVVGASYINTVNSARHAFLYSDGEVYDLNARVDPTLGWTISYAYDINDNGQICGYGNNGTSANASFILDPAIPGDANLDKSVDLLDLTILGGNWRGENKKWWEGDFNDDGAVDLLDLTILGGNWRSTTTSFSEAMRMVQFNEIPEPGTFVLLAAAAIGLAAEFLRRRRQK